MRGYNPHEIARQIHSRRISVLVCVPKILDVLREYVLRAVPEAAQAPLRERIGPNAGGSTAASTSCSVGSSGHSSSEPPRLPPSWKSSGSGSGLSSFRATD